MSSPKNFVRYGHFLTFQITEVWFLPNRIMPSSKGTKIQSLYIILQSFIKKGQEIFEIIDQHIQTQTDTHTDTYTPMKIIHV